MTKPKLGRPLKGKEVRERYSVRMEPKIQAKLTKKHKGFQKAMDKLVAADLNLNKNK